MVQVMETVKGLGTIGAQKSQTPPLPPQKTEMLELINCGPNVPSEASGEEFKAQMLETWQMDLETHACDER